MSQLKLPKKPVPDWEKVRDEWVQAVEQLVTDVESWCKARDWPTRRVEKRMEDSRIGEYHAPALVIQADLVKLMLEPVARFTPGGDGVVDLYQMPAYADAASLFRRQGKWFYLATVENDDAQTPDEAVGVSPGWFDEASFADIVSRLK